MAFVEMHARRRNPEHARDLITIPMGDLGSAVEFENVARAVVATDGAAGLERHTGMAPNSQFQRDHRMRVAERGVDVAVFLANNAGLSRATGLELSGLLLCPQQRRQFFDLQHDPVCDVLGEIRILGKDGRDRIAYVAHSAARQYALTIRIQSRDLAYPEVDRRNIRDVRSSPNGVYAGRCASGRRIDRNEFGVGVRRAHHPHI